MDKKRKIKITKAYERKVSKDFQTWLFRTELTDIIEVSDGKELEEKSDILFRTAQILTNRDIVNTLGEELNGLSESN